MTFKSGVKIVGGIIIAIGVGAIVKNLISATTPVDTGKLTMFCIRAGCGCVGSLAAGASIAAFNGQIDRIANAINTLVEKEQEENILKTET